MRLATLFLFLAACPADDADDATKPEDTDPETDTDPGTTDTGTPPITESTVAATVVTYDGSTPAGIPVQLCDHRCFPGETTEGGVIYFDGIEAGEYKLDALGETVDDSDFGNVRVHLEVADYEDFVVSVPLFIPQLVATDPITSAGTYTFGDVRWTFDPADIELPFGAEDGLFEVGVIPGEPVAGLHTVDPAFALAFSPFGAVPLAPFDLEVDSDAAAGTYDVYYLDDHGNALESGTATADGALVTATDLEPGFLTWLLFVPQG